jgi:parallel beta-helix repeat protein
VPAFVGSPAVTITGNDASGNTGIGFDIQSPCAFRNNTANNNGAPGVNFQSMADMVAYNVTARGNTTGEVQVNNANVEIYTLDTNTVGGSTVPQIFFPNNTGGKAVVYNWTQYTGVSPLAKLTSLGSPAAGQTANNSVASQKEGGVAANNSVYTDQGVITTTGVVGQPGSGIAWKLSPNANAFASSPLRLNIGKIACPANVPTYVTYWAKFSAAGPSALSSRCLVVGMPESALLAQTLCRRQ